MMQPIDVLIVEDEAGLARLVQEWLAGSAYHTAHVGTLAEALRALDGNMVDVVLLDLNLPDSRGLNTLRALREKQRYVPVVVVTGVEESETANEAIRAGAQSYLLKSKFDAYWLRHAIAEAIERFRLQTTLHAKVQYELRSAARGFVWMCAQCLKLRYSPTQEWLSPADWLSRHGVDVSHSVCPACRDECLAKAEAIQESDSDGESGEVEGDAGSGALAGE